MINTSKSKVRNCSLGVPFRAIVSPSWLRSNHSFSNITKHGPHCRSAWHKDLYSAEEGRNGAKGNPSRNPEGHQGGVSAKSLDINPFSARPQVNAEGADWSRGVIWHSSVRPLLLLLFLSRQYRFTLLPVVLTGSQMDRWTPMGAGAPPVLVLIREAGRQGTICPGRVLIKKFLIDNCSEIR